MPLPVILLAAAILISVVLATVALGAVEPEPVAYFPLILRSEPPPPPPQELQEVRALWVTRFDWTVYGQPAQKSKIDEIVNNASRAGFNMILFQVRGTADAYYQPGPEPWAQRVSGSTLGTPPNPYWDPLAYFVQKAHAKGIQLHAYINVYPVWDNCSVAPPSNTSPQHFYWQLRNYYGTTGDKPNGLQWDTDYNVSCSGYLRATPASVYGDNHYLEVARYLANNYDIDGLHLDHIRYAASNTSCDPVSASASGVSCFQKPSDYASYAAWQRAQVNGTVWKFYDMISKEHPDLMLSAAVWPTYVDYWSWGYTEGYSDYYQDSQAWIKGGYIDALMPMIYSSNEQTFRLERWQLLVQNFQQNSGGRFIIAGIGSNHYSSFAGIEDRINSARQLGTIGHAIFSYGGLKDQAQDYFQMLADGPYAQPAVVPDIPWH
jgi:uncharacterized lipoprotein YddW (UPF0748 family)